MRSLDSLSSPAKIERKLLEKDVQEKCVEWARKRGYWARKFSSISQRSVPDYLFSCPSSVFIPALKFAVEFKAPGKHSTDAQHDEQQAMRDAGWYVFECDNFFKFEKAVREYEIASAI